MFLAHVRTPAPDGGRGRRAAVRRARPCFETVLGCGRERRLSPSSATGARGARRRHGRARPRPGDPERAEPRARRARRPAGARPGARRRHAGRPARLRVAGVLRPAPARPGAGAVPRAPDRERPARDRRPRRSRPSALIVALAALQPLLLPFVLIGYLPLWIVASLNTRDLYRFSARDDAERAAARLPPERAHGPQRGEGGARLQPGRRSFAVATTRCTTSGSPSCASSRGGGPARALLGSLASSAVTVGTIAMLAWLYTTGSHDAGGGRRGGLRPLPARGPAARAAHQRDVAVRGDALHPRLLVVPRRSSRPSRRRDGRTPAPQSFERLTAEDVSFTYPESARPAVDGVSLEIARARSSRSSARTARARRRWRRCSPGLYRPETGRIRWDDLDLARCGRRRAPPSRSP